MTQPAQQKPIARIIGAGVAGLASAIRLAHEGYQVHVHEANAYFGGKLSEIQLDGYRFDAGPSLFTMPEKVLELLKLANVPAADFPYIRLDELCRYWYEDGTKFTAWADETRFAEAVSQATGTEPKPILDYLKATAKKYNLIGNLFLDRPMYEWQTYANGQALKAYPRLPSLGLTTTMAAVNAKAFSHPALQQYFNRYATYNGSDPWQTPGLLTVIPHLEHHLGAYFPKEGMIQISRRLYQAAEKMGVTFHFSHRVHRILTKEGKAVGLLVNDGLSLSADLVICNMDINHAWPKLLPDHQAPSLRLKQEKSSSALIFYWGIQASFEELGLHNIFFAKDYRREFEAIFQTKTLYHDPTVYINITSKHQPSDAPSGCENWFVMVNVPHDNGQDWDKAITSMRQAIIDKISRLLGRDIAPLIAVETILEPRLIESKTSSARGALYGNSSNSPWAAFLRHPDHISTVKDLYFVGGSVHPGGGIPLALSSAAIMHRQIKKGVGLS